MGELGSLVTLVDINRGKDSWLRLIHSGYYQEKTPIIEYIQWGKKVLIQPPIVQVKR